jgi:hypothetical protein
LTKKIRNLTASAAGDHKPAANYEPRWQKSGPDFRAGSSRPNFSTKKTMVDGPEGSLAGGKPTGGAGSTSTPGTTAPRKPTGPAGETAPEAESVETTPRKPDRRKPDTPEEFGDDPRSDLPRRKRISDGNKQELQESGWLRKRLPDVKRRREFMDWLKANHRIGEEHVHLRPGSRVAEEMLTRFVEEVPE